MALPVTITGLSTAVAPVGPFKVAIPQTLFSISTGNTTGFVFGNTTANNRRAQSFTMPAGGGSVGSIAVFLAKVGAPTDNLQVDIYPTDGAGKPITSGSSLGSSSTISGSTLTGTQTQYTFTFATSVALTASTQYAAVLSRSAGLDASNYYSLGTASSNVNATELSSTESASWITATADLSLVVNGGTPIDAYYFFGRDGTTATTLRAFKATAPDTSWTAGATKTGFTTAILGLAGYQVGSTIHLAITDGTSPTLLATKYVSYDATNDTFLATTETIAAASSQIAAAGTPSIVVRSNGEVVAFFNGVGTKTSSTTYSRVYYSRRTGVNTWAAAVEVDPSTAVNSSNPVAVLGQADRVHFAHVLGANTGYRTLSAANALNTAGSSASMAVPGDGCGYDRAGTFKVVFTSAGANQITMRFNSADNPTPTFVSQSIANARDPHRIGSDDLDDSVTIVYSNSADSDLYAIKSTDDGATFGAPASLFIGTVGATDLTLSRSASGSIYDRGASTVVGYVVNDNGTWKYNEFVLRQAIATGPGALAAGTSTAAGVGVATIRGTAALSAAISTAAGVGVSSSLGTGALSVAAASIAGTGTAADAATGTIIYYYDPTRVTRSNGNITVVNNATDLNPSTVISQSTRGATKVYAELHIDANARNFMFVGVGLTTELLDQYTGTSATAYGWVNVSIVHNGSTIATGMPAHHAGDTVALAVDRIARTLRVRNVTTNSVWSDPVDISDIAANDLCFVATFDRVNDQYTFNFDGAFAGLPPGLGYTRWDGTAFSYSFPEVTGTGALQAVPISRTNLVGYSEQLETWDQLNLTVNPDYSGFANPIDGLYTAEQLVDDNTTNRHGLTYHTAVPAGTYTFSIYLRAQSLIWAQLLVASDTASVWANFDILTPGMGLDSGGVTTSIIQTETGFWARCSITITVPGPNIWIYVQLLPSDQADPTYLGSFNQILGWGGQLESGAAPTAYIPNATGSALTVIDPPLAGAGWALDKVTGTGALSTTGPIRTNLIPNSQQLNLWIKSSATVVADVAVAPDGSTTAESVTDIVSNACYLSKSVFNTPVDIYTYSIHVKADTFNWVQVFCVAGSSSFWANFDVASGALGLNSGGVTPAITSVGNGWYRCSITLQTPTFFRTAYFILIPGDQSTSSYVGTGNGRLLGWGAQVEVAPAPTAYIPTTTVLATVTDSLVAGVGTVSAAAGVTGTGALISGAAAGNNLIWWSQDFENAWWTRYNSTLAANNTQAPDGTSTADTLTTTTGTNLHALLGQLITVGPGTYTQSIYAKAGTCHILEIQIPNCYGQFDLVNGVVFLSVPAGSVISDAGNGWWRCSVTGTYADPTRNIQPTYTLTDDTGNEVFDAVVSLSLWGAQLEPGAVGPYAATQAGPAVGGALLVGVGTVIDSISNITGDGALAANLSTLTGVGAVSGGIATTSTIFEFAAADVVISNGGLTATRVNSSGQFYNAVSSASAGAKVYCEFRVDTAIGGNWAAGCGPFDLGDSYLNNWFGATSNTVGWFVNDTTVYFNGNSAGTAPLLHSGDSAAIAYEKATGTLRFRNITTDSAWSSPIVIAALAGKNIVFGFTNQYIGEAITANFDSAFVSSPPDASYTKWNGEALGGGTTTVTGTGILAVATSSLTALGTSISTGTAILPGTISTLSAAGKSISTGTAVLAGTAAALTASGLSKGTGTGTLSCSVAVLAAAGASSSQGTIYALVAGQSVPSGAGVSRSLGTGTLAATASTINAAGTSAIIGSGVLAANSSVLAGLGVSASLGTIQSLSAGLIVSSGAGVSLSTGTGALLAGPAALAGLGAGVTLITGSGALLSASAVTLGAGLSVSFGTGSLAAATAALAGSGVTRWVATGALTANTAALSGAGLSIWIGTGALADQTSALVGSGVTRWVASGTLAASTPASIFGAGTASYVASGALLGGAAALVAVGSSSSTATGALPVGPAAISGFEGVAIISGAGTLLAQVSQVGAIGLSRSQGTGVLPSGNGALLATGSSQSLGAGAIPPSSAALAASGTSASSGSALLASGAASAVGSGVVLPAVTGTGTLAAGAATVLGAQGVVIIQGQGDLRGQVAQVVASGVTRSIGAGTLINSVAQVDAVGLVQAVGTGALAGSRSTALGTGGGLSLGSGAVDSGPSLLNGVGLSRWAAVGFLPAGPARVASVGFSTSVGSGVLTAGVVTVTGEGILLTTGAGALAAGSATVFGSAVLATTGAGVLTAQEADVTAVGLGRSVGSGALSSAAHVLDGEGTSQAVGQGAVLAKPAQVTGFASLTAYGGGDLAAHAAVVSGNDLVVGTGIIVPAVSTLSGTGNVGEPTYPEPAPMPGGYPGVLPWYGGAAVAGWNVHGIPLPRTDSTRPWRNPGTGEPLLPPPPWWNRAA